MKAILSTVIIFLLLSNIFIAQNVPNPSFEAWTPSGSEPPFDWEEPTSWKSNNAVVEFSGASITLTDDAFDGDFAVKLSTPNLFGDVVPGMLVNGNPTLDFASYSVNVETGGTPLSELTDLTNSPPIQMSGYYKFETTSLSDSAFVEVLLTKFNTETNQVDTTSYGKKLLAPTDLFSSFTVHINDLETGIEPDNIIVAFYSTNPSNPMLSGQLIVDQIGFEFLITNVGDSELAPSDVMIYPNPISTHLRLALECIGAEKTIEVYTLYGERIITVVSKKKVTEINFDSLESGVYIVRILDNFHRLIKTERVVKM